MADSEIIFTVEESPEGGYEARSLGYSIFTQADRLEDEMFLDYYDEQRLGLSAFR